MGYGSNLIQRAEPHHGLLRADAQRPPGRLAVHELPPERVRAEARGCSSGAQRKLQQRPKRKLQRWGCVCCIHLTHSARKRRVSTLEPDM